MSQPRNPYGHTGQDAMMLPTLAEHHPHLRDMIDRLRAEHQTVVRISSELEALLADAASADPDGAGGSPPAPA